MFIKLKNKATQKEVNFIISNIIAFEPTIDGKDSIVKMLNGEAYVVEESCLSIRNAFKRPSTTIKSSSDA